MKDLGSAGSRSKKKKEERVVSAKKPEWWRERQPAAPAAPAPAAAAPAAAAPAATAPAAVSAPVTPSTAPGGQPWVTLTGTIPWREPTTAAVPTVAPRRGRGAGVAASTGVALAPEEGGGALARVGRWLGGLVSGAERPEQVRRGGRGAGLAAGPEKMFTGTAERVGAQLGEAWEKVGAPLEGAALPGAYAQAMEQTLEVPSMPALRAGTAGVEPVVRRGGRGAGLVAAPEETVAGAGGAWMSTLPAAWHDIKQVPVLGQAARGAQAVLESAMTGLQAPAWAVEEEIGKLRQQLPAEMSLWSLSPGQRLTEEQQAAAQQISEERGIPLWVAQQGVAAAGRTAQPTVREYAVQQYGAGEGTERALGRLAVGLGYSTYEAQVKGLDRLMAGEELETVVSGRSINTLEPSEEEQAAFRVYVEGVRQREGEDAAMAAAQTVVERGFIPGESDVGTELLFQIGLDPLNLLDLGAWKKGFDARKARAAGRWATEASQWADEAAAATSLMLQHGQDAAQAVGKADEAGNLGMFRALFDKANPLTVTARTEAETLANTAYQLAAPAVMQVENGGEAAAMVRALAEDPEALRGVMGVVPLSEAAQPARPLLAAVADEVGNFKSVQAPEFSRVAFMDELNDAMMLKALEMTGASEETLSAYQKFASGFKGAMSEFYLRTPGYAIRNAIGDLTTMAWDGVFTLDGRQAMTDFLGRFGPTTRRIQGAAAGAQVAELGGEATRLPGVLGQVSGRLGTWISKQEEGRYLRAFYAGLKKGLKEVWRPRLPEELAAMLSPGAARGLERALADGVNAEEFAAAVTKVAGAAPETGVLVDVGRYLDDPDQLSVGLRLWLEGELGKAGSADEVSQALDGAAELARENAGRAFGADPTPPGRRVWSDVEAVQDLREEQGWLEGLGVAAGVGEEDTGRAAAQLADALGPGERAIREAEETLFAAAATQFDQDAADLLRSIRAQTGRMKMEERAAADALRAEAWRAAEELRGQGQNAGVVWQQYFSEVGQLHLEAQTTIAARLQEGLDDLARLRAGEGFEAVLGQSASALVDESLAQLRAVAADVAGRQARMKRLGLERFETFDGMLDAQRLTVDVAEAEAWRLAAMNPTRDGVDIIASTQDGVDRLGRAAAQQVAEARARMLGRGKGPRLSKDQFSKIADEVWRGYFRDASQGWDLARWELAQLPLNPRAQLRALTALGWPAEDAAQLAPEVVQAVLGAGVRWDPLLGAPTIPLGEALRGTAWEVAQAVGLDLKRSADWGVQDWQLFAQRARALADEAGGRASLGGRVVTAAAEVTAEAAQAAPKTVATGMELAWPGSVDDVARAMGLRPQTMGPEDWARVAEYATQRADEVRGLEAAAEQGVAASGRWAEVAAEAQGVAGGGRHVVEAPGLYDAAGYPVGRTRAGRVRPQRAVVERAAGMVPEPERLGVAGATVGFEERQVYLAERYRDLQEMARARVGLLQDGQQLGRARDVPMGVVKVTTRRDEPLYLLDLVDEENFVVRTYAYDSWADARQARDEARAIIEGGQQGTGAALSTAWSAWGTEDVAAADRRAAALGGYAGGPVMADAAAVVEQQELAALERIRAGVLGEWEELAGRSGVDPGVRRRLLEWARTDLAKQWSEARATAVEMARDGADFALLDYGKRRNVDSWLQLAFPYSYWKTRSARNWALRFLERPGALASYLRYSQATEQRDRERGYRARFAGKVEIPVEGLPEWTGQAVFADPGMVMPWTQILGPGWIESPLDADTTVEAMYRVSQRLGLRPYGFIEWPLQYSGWIGEGAEEMGYVLPHTGAVQAVTAAAGIGPPGGVSLEQPLRRGLGLPEQEPYGAYRVARMLGNMAAENPEVTQTALMAQELQRLVETGDLNLNEAMGWEMERASPAVARVARDMGWSEVQLEEAQGLLQEAVRRAGMERGLQAGTSFLTGVGLSMYPAGEREQVELEREQRGVQYSPLTGEGSREAMLQWREEHPQTIPRRVARAALPGAGEYEGWTPGEAWQSQEYYARRDEIDQQYEGQIEALLREQPWNKQGVRELEEQQQAEVEALRAELGIETEEGYRPRSTYGAGPEETAQIRREEVLGIVSGAMPRMAQFKDAEGRVDYEAYQAAVDGFFADLGAQLGDDPRLAAVAEEMVREGSAGAVAGAVPGRGGPTPLGEPVVHREERGVSAEGLLAGITREELEAYWRRNDRPLEAAQRVWEEAVYSAAWDAYNQAVEQGMDKGDAYERYIEGAEEVGAESLIEQILAAYPDRWTRKELQEELQGVTFPGAAEVSLLRKPEEEQALSRAQSAFWDFLDEGLPPGRMAQGARDYTLVQLVLDAETRGTATAEQYERALQWMETWAAQHYDAEEWGTPQEWAQARADNEDWKAQAEQALPGIEQLLDEYYDLSTEERRAFRDEHPEVGQYYDLRDAFGAEHPVWARYYLSEGTATRVATGGGYTTTRGGAPWRTYTKWRGGGGKGRRKVRGGWEPDWVFAYQARRTPKFYLTSELRLRPMAERYKPYYVKGTPWVFGGKWKKY